MFSANRGGAVQPFKYTHLDVKSEIPQIRLIRILRTGLNDKEPVVIEIRHATLADRYIALSYTWGPESPTYSIRAINCQTGVIGELKVRENLHAFLSRVSKRAEWEEYWIDALCLDQDNLWERNHQVQRMHEIYQRASKVQIWLGEVPEITYLLSLSAKTLRQSPNMLPATIATLARQNPKALFDGRDFLTQDAYWSRMWIIQEFLLAGDTEVISGNARLHISQLLKVQASTTELVMGERRLLSNGFTSQANQMRDLMQQANELRQRDLGIIDLIRRVKPHKYGCSDPRDRIYGLLGLAKDRNSFAVDYGLTTSQLLRRVDRYAGTSDFRSDVDDLSDLLSALKLDAASQLERSGFDVHHHKGMQGLHWNLECSTQDNTANSNSTPRGSWTAQRPAPQCRCCTVDSGIYCSTCAEFKRAFSGKYGEQMERAWTNFIAVTLHLKADVGLPATGDLSYERLFDSWLNYFVMPLTHIDMNDHKAWSHRYGIHSTAFTGLVTDRHVQGSHSVLEAVLQVICEDAENARDLRNVRVPGSLLRLPEGVRANELVVCVIACLMHLGGDLREPQPQSRLRSSSERFWVPSARMLPTDRMVSVSEMLDRYRVPDRG